MGLAAVIALKCKSAAFAAMLLVLTIWIPYLLAAMLPPLCKVLCIGANLSGHAVLQTANNSLPIVSGCISLFLHCILLYRGAVRQWCKK